jgi:hypothetical protein
LAACGTPATKWLGPDWAFEVVDIDNKRIDKVLATPDAQELSCGVMAMTKMNSGRHDRRPTSRCGL